METAETELQDAPVDSPDSAPDESSRKSGSRWWLWLIVGVLGLPSLLTVTGSGQRLLPFAHPKLARVTTFDSATLHWWAPVEFRNVRVRNTRAHLESLPELLVIPSVRTTEPLWKIMLQRGRGLHLELDRPEVRLAESDEGTNAQLAMTDLFGSSSGDGTRFPVDVTIQGGRVDLVQRTDIAAESVDSEPWTLHSLLTDVDLHISTLDTSSLIPDLSLTARTSSDPPAIASVNGLLLSEDTSNPVAAAGEPNVRLLSGWSDDSRSRTVKLRIDALDLGRMKSVLTSFVPGANFGGVISAQVNAHLLGRRIEDGFALQMAANGHDILWRQSDWVDGESLQFRSASASAAVAVAEDGIVVSDLTAQTPVGELRGDGEIRIAANELLQSILNGSLAAGPSPTDGTIAEAASASAGQVNINGQLDLAAVSAMLPRTLHLQKGTQLRNARVRYSARAQPSAATDPGRDVAPLNWQLIAETTEFLGDRDGRKFRWDSPVRLQASGPLSLNAAGLAEATVSGDFGRVSVSPAPQNALSVQRPEAVSIGGVRPVTQWNIDGDVNIDQLWNGIGQFIELSQPGVRGQVKLHASASVPTAETLHLSTVRVQADNLRIRSERLQVRTDRPFMQMFDGQATVDGSGAAIRSLVAPWIDLSALAGESSVTATLDAVPADYLALKADIRPGSLAALPTARPAAEDALRISDGRIEVMIAAESTPDRYVIREGLVELPGVHAHIQGTLETVQDVMTTDLVVDVGYDWEQLSPLLPPIAGRPPRVTGKHQTQIRVEGAPAFRSGSAPDGVRPLAVSGTVEWDSAECAGLRLGSGTAPFRFENGLLRTEPIHCSVNGGKLSAMLSYDVQQNILDVASGSRIEKLTLTPDLIAQWMSYVAPLLGESTDVSGTVSVRMAESRFNVSRPELSVMGGIVETHGVSASPDGALVTLLEAIDQLRPGRRSTVRDVVLPPQQVPFQVRDGVIAHDELHMTLSGYDIRSQGRVGLNEQIQLVLDVPLERSTEQQTGRSLRVPVGGTMRRPQIDIARLTQQEGRRQIENRLTDEVDRGLNRLFDRIR